MNLSIDIPTPVERLVQSCNASSMPAPHPEKLGDPDQVHFLLNPDGIGKNC